MELGQVVDVHLPKIRAFTSQIRAVMSQTRAVTSQITAITSRKKNIHANALECQPCVLKRWQPPSKTGH
eukprot:947463-Rhodomonas_salina.1